MTDNIVVLVTVPSKQDAENISKTILDKKICACVNIVDGVKSFFYWKEKIENSEEFLLIIKTNKQNYQKLEDNIKKIHPYTVPEIIALPIILGSADYLEWLNDTVK
ncbi:MAG: divalent-cation tolerance protein CutA [bacterium]